MSGYQIKRCGKKWAAHLCAPGAEHECTRPASHEGRCACKCGVWHLDRDTTGGDQ